VARLLRDNKALGGQPNDEIPWPDRQGRQAAINAALDDLGAELGIDL
jgi:hypothetical protein